jgi:hypothetical protein
MRILSFVLIVLASGIGFAVVRFLRAKGFEPDTISLFTTLWGTAIGVVLAIWFTDVYTSYGQKAKLRTLYEVADRELNSCVERVGHNIVAIKEKRAPFYQIEVPTVLDRLTLEPEYQQFFSPVMKHSMFPRITRRLAPPTTGGKRDEILEAWVGYHIALEFRICCIRLEREYLDGKTTPERMSQDLETFDESTDKYIYEIRDEPSWKPHHYKNWWELQQPDPDAEPVTAK